MKKIISLLFLTLLLTLTLTSCGGGKPDLEEVKPRLISLIEASYEINDIFFGDGIEHVDYEAEYQKRIDEYAPALEAAQKELAKAQANYDALQQNGSEEAIAAAKAAVEEAQREVTKNTFMFTKEEFLAQYDTDPLYISVQSEKYFTIEDIKAAAEEVYSASYLMSIYQTMFVGYVESGMTDVLYARYYDSAQGLMILKDRDIWVTGRRLYDYDSMKIVRPSNSNRITVEIDSHLEGESEPLTVRLSFVKQDGEWYLNSPSY